MADGIEAFFEEQDPEETVEETTGEESSEETTEGATGTEESTDSGDSEGDTGEESTEASEEDPGEGEEVVETESSEAGEESEASDTDITISSLRQMLREQAQEIQTLKAQTQGLNQTLVEQGTIDESDLDPDAVGSGGVSEDRLQSLSLLAETMKVNPQFGDFEEVCSQVNFDSTVEALAHLAVQEDGGTLTEQVQNVTSYIWNLPNPYKFVYDFVKENHPKYAESSEGAAPPPKKEPPKAPTSVASVAGGSGSKNDGWTAAKIDSMDEMELHKVPAAVYEQYLTGELK